MVRLHTAGGATALPLTLIALAVPMLTRRELASLTEHLIDRLDMIDGDPEREEDDPSGQCDEDEVNTGHGNFVMHGTSYLGPGCPIAGDDEPGHVWPESDQRGLGPNHS